MEAASRERVRPYIYFCQYSPRWSDVRRPYRLEDPDGISLVDIVEQQVRANKPSKARPYYCDPFARVLHVEVVVGVSWVELCCCCLLGKHDVQTVVCPRLQRPQSQNRYRPSLPKLLRTLIDNRLVAAAKLE
jgi:hypothetical protein